MFNGIYAYVIGYVAQAIGLTIRQELFDEILSKDVEFFDSRKTGDLISRLEADTAKIEAAAATQLVMVIKSTLYILLCLAVFFYISWQMSLFTLGVMLPVLCLGPIYGGFVREYNKKISDAKASASEHAEEIFGNVRTVKAFATEDAECLIYQERNDEIFAYEFKVAIAYGFF